MKHATLLRRMDCCLLCFPSSTSYGLCVLCPLGSARWSSQSPSDWPVEREEVTVSVFHFRPHPVAQLEIDRDPLTWRCSSHYIALFAHIN